MEKEKLIELGVAEEIADKILALHTTELTSITKEKETAELKISGIEKQLNEANVKIGEFGEGTDIQTIKQNAKDWEEKYNKDTKDLNALLEKNEYEYTVRDFLSGYKFTSDLAKNAVVAEINQKGFKLDAGKLVGGDEYMKSLMEANPQAFASDEGVPTIMTRSVNAVGGVSGVEAAFYGINPSLATK